jgi:hypothetical protein
LIFCTAFLLPEGGSLIAALNNTPLPWFIIDVSFCYGISGNEVVLISRYRETKLIPKTQKQSSTTISTIPNPQL